MVSVNLQNAIHILSAGSGKIEKTVEGLQTGDHLESQVLWAFQTHILMQGHHFPEC